MRSASHRPSAHFGPTRLSLQHGGDHWHDNPDGKETKENEADGKEIHRDSLMASMSVPVLLEVAATISVVCTL